MAIGGYEMDLPKPSLAEICLQICNHINNLGAVPPNDVDSSWAQVEVITGAPGTNLIDANVSTNTLNIFFYRFKPAGFNAGAGIGDIHWMKVFCIITAFGFDESEDKNLAGINELRMLSEVMRLFQEEPIKIFKDINDKDWHVQFIPKPLADEQINQIWSTQGSVIYRPSVVYEIALAPIEPVKPTTQSARVASIGAVVDSNINNRFSSWPDQRKTRFPLVPTMSVDVSNPQWAPAIVIIKGDDNQRTSHLSLNFEIKKDELEDFFNNFPKIDIWIAGEINEPVSIIGQLFQNPPKDEITEEWQEIKTITKVGNDNVSAKVDVLDKDNLPNSNNVGFTFIKDYWTDINDNRIDSLKNNWQLQLFAERKIIANNIEIRIRSNPVLITIAKEKE